MRKSTCIVAAAALSAALVACGGKDRPAAPTAPTAPTAPANLTAPAPSSPAQDEQLDTLRPTLVVTNGTSDQQGTRTYEFQISDSESFASGSAFAGTFAATVAKAGVAEGSGGTTAFTVDQDLQPTTRYYWRARVAQGSAMSAWSATRTLKTRLVGFIRAGEIYDPLIHGETVGERVGATTFIPGKGIRLDNGVSYVRYLVRPRIDNGEFSMDVEGLRPNAPGDKTKVFGMQDGGDDFVTNRYRIDVQYRGAQGVPPNAIQWRAMFGSDADRIEPDTDYRFRSVFLLDPNRTYHWKGTWSNGFRLTMRDGGLAGTIVYDFGITGNLHYNVSDHRAYLGTPAGRSGNESASIAGAIYRNVWLGNRPRPASLGSALLPLSER